MMRFPQSVGCIGGTPRHSLYFVGTKGEELHAWPACLLACLLVNQTHHAFSIVDDFFTGDQLIHLDPHTVQPCAKAPAAPTTVWGNTGEHATSCVAKRRLLCSCCCSSGGRTTQQEFLPTYSCPKPGFMAANKIDPSLAVGFYVATEAEYDDLATRLRQVRKAGQ